jgi:hypothetical protein
MGNSSIKMSTQIANKFYKFNQGSVLTENGQDYMSLSLNSIPDETVNMNSFIIPDDNNPNFMDENIKEIKSLAKNSQPVLLAPVYYNEDDEATDYQCGVTETGKPGESFYNMAKRGLIEELGLTFIENANFPQKEHYCTRKNKFQHCMTYLVSCNKLKPVTISDFEPHIKDSNTDDFKGIQPDFKITENKVQIFIFGTQAEMDHLINQINLKPLKFNKETNKLEYYDDDIHGVTTLSIRRLNRFRKVLNLRGA